MRSTRPAGWAAAASAATITMTELSPRADTDQGENPWSFDAMTSATGTAMAKPRANDRARSRPEREPYGEFLGSPGEERGGDAMQSRDGEQQRQKAKTIEQFGGRAFHEQGVLIVLPQGFGGCNGGSL